METPNSQPSGFSRSDLERIKRSTFIHVLEYHHEIPSTNDRAIVLLEDPTLVAPALVLAGQQTAGRGRGANRWWSASGSLTFSLVLGPAQLGTECHWPRLSLTAGLAVCEALHDLRPGLEIGLKWPNDVFVQDRKICGILVDVPPSPENRIVIGIGINVNNSFTHDQGPLSTIATSLIDASGYSYDLTSVLIGIVTQLDRSLSTLATNAESLCRKWQSLCVLTGHSVQVDVGSRRTLGTCLGVDMDGALLVDSNTGLARCVSGIVTRLD